MSAGSPAFPRSPDIERRVPSAGRAKRSIWIPVAYPIESGLPHIWPHAECRHDRRSAMQFTFTIADSEDAKRLEDDLRRDPRIYTRSKKDNGQSNVGKQFRLTQ